LWTAFRVRVAPHRLLLLPDRGARTLPARADRRARLRAVLRDNRRAPERDRRVGDLAGHVGLPGPVRRGGVPGLGLYDGQGRADELLGHVRDVLGLHLPADLDDRVTAGLAHGDVVRQRLGLLARLL